MVRLIAICSLFVFAFSPAAPAQVSIFAGAVLGTAEVSKDGILVVNQNYTELVPETRTRTQPYTVTIVTADAPREVTRTREIPYTITRPVTRHRVIEVSDYQVEFKTGKLIEKGEFLANIKKQTKPRPVLVLNGDQKISALEQSMLSSKVIVIRNKRPKMANPFLESTDADLFDEDADLFDEDADVDGSATGSGANEEAPLQ